MENSVKRLSLAKNVSIVTDEWLQNIQKGINFILDIINHVKLYQVISLLSHKDLTIAYFTMNNSMPFLSPMFLLYCLS